eukprot:TRINITY_DN51641_c0_g1_i1.p1 TRINITY_DN51641_c0_g1~~TRINITY_DN51641_c0_g1_i1.p1  ORF type:complete len:333 (-),score=27.69 TRINITY_DN51641_c0_g1_i1:153-1151(-)
MPSFGLPLAASLSLLLDSVRGNTRGLVALQTGIRHSKVNVPINDSVWNEEDEASKSQEHSPAMVLTESPCSDCNRTGVTNASGISESPASIFAESSVSSIASNSFFGPSLIHWARLLSRGMDLMPLHGFPFSFTSMKGTSKNPRNEMLNWGSYGYSERLDYHGANGSLVLELHIRNKTLQDVFGALGGLSEFLPKVRNSLSSCVGMDKRNVNILGVFQRYQVAKRSVDPSDDMLGSKVLHTRVVVRFMLSTKGELGADPQAAFTVLRRMLSEPESKLMQSSMGQVLSDAEISVGISQHTHHHMLQKATDFRPLTLASGIAILFIAWLIWLVK